MLIFQSFLRHSFIEADTKFNMVPWCILLVGDPRNFDNSFFGKNYLQVLSMVFLSIIKCSLGKRENKASLKRCKPAKNHKSTLNRQTQRKSDEERERR